MGTADQFPYGQRLLDQHGQVMYGSGHSNPEDRDEAAQQSRKQVAKGEMNRWGMIPTDVEVWGP